MAEYIKREDVEYWILTQCFSVDTCPDREYVVERMKEDIPAADVVERPHNATNLCDSCKYDYPECPSKADDVIFGDGKGNDNIIACAVYDTNRKRGKWKLHKGEGKRCQQSKK